MLHTCVFITQSLFLHFEIDFIIILFIYLFIDGWLLCDVLMSCVLHESNHFDIRFEVVKSHFHRFNYTN